MKTCVHWNFRTTVCTVRMCLRIAWAPPDISPFSFLAAVSALAKFGAQNENLLPSILVLLQRWVDMAVHVLSLLVMLGSLSPWRSNVRPGQNLHWGCHNIPVEESGDGCLPPFLPGRREHSTAGDKWMKDVISHKTSDSNLVWEHSSMGNKSPVF